MPRGTAETVRGQKRRPSREEDYESDDEFVENDGSDVEKGRSSKKQKKEPKEKRKSKGITNGSSWELSDKRRVSVDDFHGKIMVNIREYYEKDGEMLPGKKGIALSVAQYNALLLALPEVEAALAAMGESAERPRYDGKPVISGDGADDDDEPTADAKETKKNFEQTSEEEV